MNALYPTDWKFYIHIVLVFLRLLGLFILIPGFSHRSIPGVIRILLALCIAFAICPVVRQYLGPVPETWDGLFLAALRETAIGFLIGFTGYMTFEGISLAAQLVGYQMGFGTVGLIDPQNQSNVSVLVPLHGWLALLLFFLTDLHHVLLVLFIESFKTTAASAPSFANPGFSQIVVGISARLFLLAIQMSAPFTLLMLCCNLTIGILSRMMPQMNILLFSFPVTILLGFMAFYLLAPEMLDFIEGVLGEMTNDVMTVVREL